MRAADPRAGGAALGPDPLDGLPRPPGDPVAVRALAQRQSAAADALTQSATGLYGALDRVVGQSWCGPAAVACRESLAAGVLDLRTLARTSGGAAASLHVYAAALLSGQQEWDRARRLADEAIAEEWDAAARAHLMSPFGVEPLVPGPAAARSQSPGRGRARAMALAALALVTGAVRQTAAVLEALVLPLRVVPASSVDRSTLGPVRTAGHSLRRFGDQLWHLDVRDAPGAALRGLAHTAVGVGEGTWDSVAGTGQALWGLTGEAILDPHEAGENWAGVVRGVGYSAQHPLDAAKVIFNVQDLEDGHYAHFVGNLVPAMATGLLTGGTVPVAAAAARTAARLRRIEQVDRAARAAGPAVARGTTAVGNVNGAVNGTAAATFAGAGGAGDRADLRHREQDEAQTRTAAREERRRSAGLLAGPPTGSGGG